MHCTHAVWRSGVIVRRDEVSAYDVGVDGRTGLKIPDVDEARFATGVVVGDPKAVRENRERRH
jgi:hypothetical protein